MDFIIAIFIVIVGGTGSIIDYFKMATVKKLQANEK